MTIKVRLMLSGLVSFLVLSIIIVISFIMIQTVQIKGALYDKIILSKDLLADILPPPEYIIETRLITYQLADSSPQDRAKLIATIASLKKDFLDRQLYWDGSALEPQMKKLVLQDIKISALNYFETTEKKLIPALEKGDITAAYALLNGELKQYYDQHRQFVDTLVIMANAQAQSDENESNDVLHTGFVTLGLATLIGIIILLSTLGFSNAIILKNINKLKAIAGSLASDKADLSSRLPIESHDEIAQTSQNLNLLFDKFEHIVNVSKEEETKIKEAHDEIH